MKYPIVLLLVLLLGLANANKSKVAPSRNDNPAEFLGSSYVSSIFGIPLSKELYQPWSGSYWPDNKGGIGQRYNAKYQIYNQPGDHLARYGQPGFQEYIDENYSPAEKYDFLVGDYDYTLTRRVRSKMGRSAYWEGICHGWAPASFMENRPVRPISVLASDGVTRVTFYPDDIKALISLFYASSINNYKTKILGTKCPVYARRFRGVTNPACFDNNPATVLLVFGNKIGLRHIPVLFDPRPDPEVWNFPAYKYSLRFWNPKTTLDVKSLNDGMLTVEEARSYKNSSFFARNADSKAAYLVGVYMDVTYASETLPNKPLPHPDKNKKETFKSVIELDAGYNIIGGSWVNRDHPDFIWKIDESSPFYKHKLDTISGFGGSPAELSAITTIAKKISMDKQVVLAVVRYLLNSSR